MSSFIPSHAQRPSLQVVKRQPQEAPKFTPSHYQQAIADFIKTGKGNAIINAVAGAGKTSTLVWIASMFDCEVLFCAFNKHIADELGHRLPQNAIAKTLHSIGFSTLRRALEAVTVDGDKYRMLIRELVSDNWPNCSFQEKKSIQDAIGDMLRFSVGNLTDANDWREMSDRGFHYGVDFPKGVSRAALFEAVQEVKARGINIAMRTGRIDYLDQIWLPIEWDLSFRQYEAVLVDECQDLNKLQCEIVKRLIAPGGRVVAVGDVSQAIYGFSGADCDSFYNLKSALNATQLPLSICYRCPSSHLELAREIVPHIEARPDAPTGTIATIPEEALGGLVQPGDLVLCRKTAPLVETCLNLIAQKLPAKVIGKDIGRSLVKLVGEVAKMKGFAADEFSRFLREYEQKETEKLTKAEASEEVIQRLIDRCQAVSIIWDTYDCSTPNDFSNVVERLFDDGSSPITFCTVHRAKGLEADRVFLLDPDSMPLTWKGQRDWELQQELNIKYVALTRSKRDLWLVMPSK